MKQLLQAALIAAIALPLFAQTPAAPATPAPAGFAPAAGTVAPAGEADTSAWRMDAGVDLRLRQEAVGNIPSAPLDTDDHMDYFRVRTRAWFEVGYENVSLYTRVAHEFRKYNGYTPAMKLNDPKNPWKFPDELVLDNFYLDVKGLAGGQLDLRVGRQDLIYGAGRVILEGTPADGSRTIFFDAIKATLRLTAKTSLDAFLIYNTPDAQDLVIGPRDDRDLTRGAGAKITEKGHGIYVKCNEVKELPGELYYVYKRETINKGVGTIPARNTHTFGARLMPQFSEQLSGELEGAVQYGETDVTPEQEFQAYMAYAGLTFKPDFGLEGKPFFTAACYVLSGDDPGAPGKDNRWNPLWARYPQFSELMVFAYPVGRYSNLVYPHLKVGMNCPCKHNLSIQAGPMFAEEEDQLAPRDKDYQGVLAAAKYEFPLVSGLFGKRGDISGHLWAEAFIPADAGEGYYADDEVAYFLRWEIMAKF